MPSNYDSPYVDEDLQYGRLLGNLLNPPADADPGNQAPRQQSYMGAMTATAPAADPVASTAAPAATPAPQPAAPTPAAVAPTKGKWADIVREGLGSALDSQKAAQGASSQLLSQPSIAAQSDPVEQSIQRDSVATPYRDPQTGKVLDSAKQYKPGIGTRIVRGVRGALTGLMQGGVLGAVANTLPSQGHGIGTDYSAPNRAYDLAEQLRQNRLQSEQQQLGEIQSTSKADTDRLKAVGSESRANITGAVDVAKAATGQQNAESGTRGQSAVLQKAAAAGLKPVMDENGNVSAWEDDPNSEAFKTRRVMSDLREAQQEKAEADTALARAKNDPNSPAFRLAVERQRTAAANASAAQQRASAYMLNATAGNLGTDTHGNQIEGGATTAEGKPIGSRFAVPYIKQEGKTAQFNDVFGATDNIEKTAANLVKAGGKLNSPRVAAAIADPKTTSMQWAQGQFATSGLSPEERDYVTNVKAYKENLQALRQSAGGGVSDAQVNRLMEMAPGASTPDLDYLKRQTGQIRLTANRLSEGMPQMKGGHKVEGGAAPGLKQRLSNANSQGGMPPQSVVDGMKEGQYVHGPGGSFQKKGGKLVPVTGGNQ